MLKLSCFIIITLLSINSIKAQEKKNSFQVMTSNGYMESNLGMRGSGHIITFSYSPHKLWGYGFDMSFLQGRNIKLERKMVSFSISPSIYLFPLNSERHQIYLGVGIGYNSMDFDIIKAYRISPEIFNEKETGIVLSANGGYNFKFKKKWLLGARAYYEYNYSPTMMYLISIGYRF